LTEDPFGGFLPPNVTSPEGEGYVSFTVRLKANLPHASVISNKATIVFDLNAPIRTNIWVNAIDRVPPTSTVSPLPAQTTHTTFMVNWNGTDQHSGVKSYSIYVSKNGAAPEVWKLNTQQKSSLFDGITGGNTYRFYSLATDSIGNQEVFNGTYHTTITILATSADDKQGMVDYFKVYPNPARDQLTVDLQVSRPAEVRLVILDVLGRQLLHQRIDAQAGDVGQFLIDISKFDKGAYFCVLETPEGRVARTIMIQR
ncbi:MAG: T9SS type A sorting domain-containing protein, partial [Bacteroidales bacterium]|nr:T9SS type A sorting domain-containing protein [Bacteroidales bacterium]